MNRIRTLRPTDKGHTGVRADERVEQAGCHLRSAKVHRRHSDVA